MIDFAIPWAFILLPLPYLINKFLPSAQEPGIAVRVPFFSALSSIHDTAAISQQFSKTQILFQSMLLILGWCLIVIALARPQSMNPPIVRVESAGNIMVAIDLSNSMEIRDMLLNGPTNPETRLDMVKRSLRTFAKEREHDRLGLIAFGSAPYLQSPFTDDRTTWLQLMDELQAGMAGQRTMLGDAIGLAIDILRRTETQNRVLLLLTDGRDTGSHMPPIEAAKIANFYDIHIYPIAVGQTEGNGPDTADIKTLEIIAAETNGLVFKATDGDAFKKIIEKLSALEPEKYKTRSFTPRHDLFHIPLAILGLGLLINIALGSIRERYQKRQHRENGSV